MMMKSPLEKSVSLPRILAAGAILAALAVTMSCAKDPKPQRQGARAVPVTVGTVMQQALPVQLTAIGHKVDKVELIVMGGTFPATPMEYQTWFIQRCLDALTDKDSANLEEAKANAEVSKTRNVGITVETRPDW